MTDREAELTHALADALAELGEAKRAMRQAAEMAELAIRAHERGKGHVVQDRLSRIARSLRGA